MVSRIIINEASSFPLQKLGLVKVRAIVLLSDWMETHGGPVGHQDSVATPSWGHIDRTSEIKAII
jgi:hypothetical protein